MFIKSLIVLIILLIFFVWIWRPKQKKPSLRASRNHNGHAELLPLPKMHAKLAQSANFIEQELPVPPELSHFELMSSLSEGADQEGFLELIQCFRKPHPLLGPLLRTSYDSKELYEIVKSDPEFCAQILKTVNSPLFYLSKEITNINHAIVFLGAVQVKNIALQIATKNDNEFSNTAQNLAYNKLWSASLLASNICFLLAKHLGKENSTELSTYCLLSYLGDQALVSYQSDLAESYLDDCGLFQRVSEAQEKLSINSAVAGRMLAEHWQLPHVVVEAIGQSLLPMVDLSKLEDIDTDVLRDILLCYISCRISDLVVFNGLRDMAELGRLDGRLGLEFQFTPDNLKLADFEKINAVLHDSVLVLKINKQIVQVVGEE